MIYWFKNLPNDNIDLSEWKPFIKNEWIRKNYMIFVYILMGFLSLLSIRLRIWVNTNILIAFFIYVLVFVLHELLHIITVVFKGDISLTHSELFFWINTNVILSKKRYFLFMSLPIIALSILPFGLCLLSGLHIRNYLMIICWFNLIIASSDIINSLLIIIKPNHTLFYKGFYKLK